jgi:hypothetical protein
MVCEKLKQIFIIENDFLKIIINKNLPFINFFRWYQAVETGNERRKKLKLL